MSGLDMFHKQCEYEMRMRQIIEDEREEKMRVIVSHLSERFAGIENFEQFKRLALSCLRKIASGEVKVPDVILYPLVEIEMVLSRVVFEEEVALSEEIISEVIAEEKEEKL